MNNKLGNRIRILRENKGMSQEKMAEKIGLSKSAYGRIETGETNNWVHLIDKICQELSTTPEELFAPDSLVQNNNDNASAVQNHTQHDTHITINQLSDKVIELYEEKIKSLEEKIQELQGNK
ncbi:MAG: helix-turn-helix domain-containing protein [Flavobacteriaceae bacterium]|jgi:transcriptional regulator with XRE-family HTH domain|nr:helix-turn-helix domain-containing protein [Flavobacteriaceae bacterium]